ncbi:hypothetical protein AWB64_00318 [Caballeronia sordidicola]|uniref:DUF4258 domain-containing protein n=1 Tax=Caballeronia sordidicola TaxID=196367 RepID=A0A158ET13_CABSO|nr:DUF4258 domain-containing protein [Caballeronia sordidicola]SAL10742.1 hypothetical protein AWB64_00318 [Caballeronia sordidicola]
MATNRDWENLIHEIAQNTINVIFTRHADEMMAARCITKAMVLETLRRGRIVRPPALTPSGHTKCRMEYDCGGDEIKVIAAVTDMNATRTVVVTSFDRDREE